MEHKAKRNPCQHECFAHHVPIMLLKSKYWTGFSVVLHHSTRTTWSSKTTWQQFLCVVTLRWRLNVWKTCEPFFYVSSPSCCGTPDTGSVWGLHVSALGPCLLFAWHFLLFPPQFPFCDRAHDASVHGDFLGLLGCHDDPAHRGWEGASAQRGRSTQRLLLPALVITSLSVRCLPAASVWMLKQFCLGSFWKQTSFRDQEQHF